jgi:hypothetical protein
VDVPQHRRPELTVLVLLASVLVPDLSIGSQSVPRRQIDLDRRGRVVHDLKVGQVPLLPRIRRDPQPFQCSRNLVSIGIRKAASAVLVPGPTTLCRVLGLSTRRR